MNLCAPWCVNSTKSNTESLNSPVKSPPFDLPAHWIFWFSDVHPPCILLKDSIPLYSRHPLMLWGRLKVWFLRVWRKEIRITPYPKLTGLILHEKWNHSSILKVRVKNKQANQTKNRNHPTPAQHSFCRWLQSCWGSQSRGWPTDFYPGEIRGAASFQVSRPSRQDHCQHQRGITTSYSPTPPTRRLDPTSICLRIIPQIQNYSSIQKALRSAHFPSWPAHPEESIKKTWCWS